MEFGELVEYFERLEGTSSRIELTEIVRELIEKAPDEELSYVLLFIQGSVFPPWDEREIGVAEKMMFKCISLATGYPEKDVEALVAKLGDTGLAAEELFNKKAQMTLWRQELPVSRVYSVLEKISTLEGEKSQDRKIKYIVELLNSCEPREAKYLVRLILGEMRLGVGEGIVRDAIAKAFNVDSGLVERVYAILNDFGQVVRIAKDSGNTGLSEVKPEIGRPIRPMLALALHSIDEIFSDFKPAQIEYKYDGMRSQFHIWEDNGERKVLLFTRRLENVTKQFPDVIEWVKKAVGPDVRNCIIEGETIAIDKDGKPLPFQVLSRRIKRKYDIEETIEKIPAQVHLFDIMFLDGESWMDKPLSERRAKLEEIIKPVEGKVELARKLVTESVEEASVFYQEALNAGHEGIMIKNPDARYNPGARVVGYMYKLKPISETLDLVIVGAEWGEGRRAKWLGSFLLACGDPDTGEFLTVGKMATGLTDQQLEDLTNQLKGDILEEEGKFVKLRPRLVVEVGYQEIQKSPKYESGFALRFPRLIRTRPDKLPDEADSLDRVARIYESQKKGNVKI